MHEDPAGRRNVIALGFDGRLSSPELATGSPRAGLSRHPGQAVGLGPRDAVFRDKHLYADPDHGDGIAQSPIITDSRWRSMAPVYGDAIQAIGAIARSGDFESGEGTIEDIDIRDIYVDDCSRYIAPVTSRCMGRRQRRDRRHSPPDDGQAAASIFCCSTRSTASSQPPPRPTVPRIWSICSGRWPARADMASASTRRTGSARSTHGPIVWATSCSHLRARSAATRLAPSSSPTSRRARCCSTRSRGWAARR